MDEKPLNHDRTSRGDDNPYPPKGLDAGVALHRAGQFADAAEAYRGVIARDESNADAHHLLGLALASLRDDEQALPHLRRAAALQPGIGEFHADLAAGLAAVGRWDDARTSLSCAMGLGETSAATLHSLGTTRLSDQRWEEAANCFELEVHAVPRKEAWNNLGVARLRLGRNRLAITSFESGLALAPNDVPLLRNLGLALAAEQQWERAGETFQRVLRFHPSDRIALWQLARALRELGMVHLRGKRFIEAIDALESSLRLEPTSSSAWNNLGLALQFLKHNDRAIECFRQAIARQPDLATARANLASALCDADRWEEATCELASIVDQPDLRGMALGLLGRAYVGMKKWEAAKTAFTKALLFDEKNPQSLLGLGDVAEQQSTLEEAAQFYAEAVRHAPDLAIGWAKLGLATKKLGDGEAARHAFSEVDRCDPSPEARYMRTAALPVVYDDPNDVEFWRRRVESEVAELQHSSVGLDANKSVLSTTFLFAYQGFNDRELNQRLASLWKTHPIPARRMTGKPARDRIRIGVLSSFLKYHTIGKLSRGWIKELSRGEFDVTVLSPYEHHDPGSDWIRAAADRTVNVPREIEAAIELVAREEFDVLFYPDIGMDPVTYALARHRLAPVQCTTWGHPVTSGIPTIDYFVSSRLLEIPEAQSHYTEELILLETLPTFYYRPPAPDATLQRDRWGLPEESHVYLCPHSHFKMHPAFDAALKGVLDQDASAVIAIIEGFHPTTTRRLRERFHRSLGEHANRVRFIPRASSREYLRLLELSDVLLDSFPFGGGNTHYEAFSVGLPVVTLPTEFMRGRVGLGLCGKMGLNRLVADDLDSYVRLAVDIGSNRESRRELRDEILARNHAIYEDHESVRQFESFLKGAVEGRRPISADRLNAANGAIAVESTVSSTRAYPESVTSASVTSASVTSASVTSRQVANQERDSIGTATTTTSIDVMRRATCPACGHHVAVPFFQPGPLPLATLAWPSTPVEALTMARLPHDFVRCVDCGHVFNAAFDYAQVPYSAKPNLMFNRGAIWREHLDAVAHLLLEHLPEQPVVVEIGCGDGHMLRAMAAIRPGGRYIGFDPNGAIDTGGGAIEGRHELFDPARHLVECRPQLVISRHVLEHLMNPLGFAQALEFAVSWTRHATKLFIEVPCIDQVFGMRRTTDFYYEHNSHFTTVSLRRMLERCAGQVDLLRTAYGGEVACALATFAPRQSQVRIADEALEFQRATGQALAALRAQLAAIIEAKPRLAIWGGTGKAAAFIQQLGLDCERFPLVVDSDAGKVGTYVPGGGQRIRARETLIDSPVDIVLIATPWRAADIVLEMKSIGIQCESVLVEYQGRLIDYHRDNHPYRLPAPESVSAPTVRLDRPLGALLPQPNLPCLAPARQS